MSTQTLTYYPIKTSFSAPFTFSAKEKDSETGLSYFSARYYSSDLSIWLSVDPMSDKYPSLSPYVYCANNPVKLVDPEGEEIWIIGSDENTRLKYTVGMQYDGSDEKIKARVENYNYAVQAIWDTRGTDSACMEEVINGFKDFSHANRNGNYTSKNLYNRKRNHTSLFSN